MAVFPKKYSFTTSLPPKRFMKRLDGDLTEYRPTLNVLSTSRFMREHKLESICYGRHEGESFEIFYHKAGKRDGGSTGFYGKVTKTENGSHIAGCFRKPVYAYIFGAVILLASLLCALGTYASGAADGAAVFLIIGIIGTSAVLWDDHEKYLKSYLEKLSDRGQSEK